MKKTILALLLSAVLAFSTALADGRVFSDLGDACDYVRASMLAGHLQPEFVLTVQAVNGRDNSRIRDILTDALEYASGYDIYFGKSGDGLRVRVDANMRPALKMLHAWETGDRSALAADEALALDTALAWAESCRRSSGLETEAAIFDLLCERLVYAHDAVAMGSDTPEYVRASTSVGAFVDGVAQCQGYAEAFWLLGKLCGLDVETQYGFPGDNVKAKHAWNVVRIGTRWYHVDVCWSDTSGDSFEPHVPDYRYFNGGLDRMPEGRYCHPEAEVAAVTPVTLPEHTAYQGLRGVTVASLAEAIDYALAQHEAGEPYAHVLITDDSVTREAMEKAMWAAVRQKNISTVWGRLVKPYAGGTWMTVRWVLGE